WHPLHVESVAWVSERKDVLSTFFFVLTVWAYVRYTERRSWRRYVLVLLWFALGLMSKPMLVTLPCVLLLLDYWPLEQGRAGFNPLVPGGERDSACEGSKPATCRRSAPLPQRQERESAWLLLLAEKLPLFVLSIGVGIATVFAQREGKAIISLHSIPFSSRLGNAVVSYAGYLQKMVWPADLCAFYPWPAKMPVGLIACSALVLIGMSLLVWRAGKERRFLTIGWLWYLVTLLPVIGLLQVGGQTMADRYTYVPLLG